MGFKLDHIGVAVKDIQASLDFYQKAMGLTLLGEEEVPSEKVKTAFLDTGECHLELLEPTSDDSPIAKFIEKRGPGVHHICLKVENIEAVMAQLKASGAKLINETPKIGAGNKKVAFIHPKSTGGVLLELSEAISEA